MNKEKAIEAMKWAEKFDCEYCTFYEPYHGRCTVDGKCSEALVVIKEALGKQITKRPKENVIEPYMMREQLMEYCCPACGCYLTDDYIEEYTNYCDECGQRIDWSEEDD